MLNDLFGISDVTGLGITINSDGSLAFNGCEIHKKGSQLDFTKRIINTTSIQEITGKLDKAIPVSLNLSGRGILLKQTEKITELNAARFGQVLPNANFDDFYIQNFISGEKSFVSIIRKSEADKWIGELTGMGLNIVMLSLGAFPVQTVMPQLNLYGEELVFAGHIITRNEQQHWTKYRYDALELAGFTLKIESEKIDEHLLPAYASAFQLLMKGRVEEVAADVNSLSQTYQKLRSDKWVKTYGAIVLFIVFILLLINFFVFSWFDDDNARLALQVSRSAQTTSDVRGIEDEVKTKEQKLKALGWDGGISKAYLIDQIAAFLPQEITWQSVEINPVDQSATRVERIIRFKDRQIRVTGLSQQIIPVNEWMARMRALKWVKSVQLENYGLDQELNTGRFTLTITY